MPRELTLGFFFLFIEHTRLFSLAQNFGFNGCFPRLCLWNGWSHSLFSRFDYHLFSTWNNIEVVMTSYLQLLTFGGESDEHFFTMGSMHCNTDGRNVWPANKTTLKKFTSFRHIPWAYLGWIMKYSYHTRIIHSQLPYTSLFQGMKQP